MYRSIIYIWYDDGVFTPSLVPKRRASSFWWACQAAATVDGRERSRRIPHEGGDNRQWRRKPRAGRRRLGRNGNL